MKLLFTMVRSFTDFRLEYLYKYHSYLTITKSLPRESFLGDLLYYNTREIIIASCRAYSIYITSNNWTVWSPLTGKKNNNTGEGKISNLILLMRFPGAAFRYEVA